MTEQQRSGHRQDRSRYHLPLLHPHLLRHSSRSFPLHTHQIRLTPLFYWLFSVIVFWSVPETDSTHIRFFHYRNPQLQLRSILRSMTHHSFSDCYAALALVAVASIQAEASTVSSLVFRASCCDLSRLRFAVVVAFSSWAIPGQ